MTYTYIYITYLRVECDQNVERMWPYIHMLNTYTAAFWMADTPCFRFVLLLRSLLSASATLDARCFCIGFYLIGQVDFPCVGWASIYQGKEAYRNRNEIEPMETETPNPDLRQHARSSQRKYQSDIETEIPSRAEIESIEPKPTLGYIYIYI